MRLYKAARLKPSSLAASVILPLHFFRACRDHIAFHFLQVETGDPVDSAAAFVFTNTSLGIRVLPWQRITALSMACCSSRMLPGQSYCLQLRHQRFVEECNGAVIFFAVKAQEIFSQRHNILFPVPQVGKVNFDGVHAGTADPAGTIAVRPFLGNVAVGGADQAHVYGLCFIGAHAGNGPVLQHGEQFGLEGNGDVTDLVQGK